MKTTDELIILYLKEHGVNIEDIFDVALIEGTISCIDFNGVRHKIPLLDYITFVFNLKQG